MTVMAVILVLLFAAVVLKTCWLQFRIKWYGKETEATVSRIEADVRTDAEAANHTRHFCYVRFLKEDGLENEARLLNPRPLPEAGSKVMIRYLPEKDNVAVLTGFPEQLSRTNAHGSGNS